MKYYYNIYESRSDMFIDCYVTEGPIQAFKRARQEYPELEGYDLRCIQSGKADARHLSSYELN